MCDPRKLAPLPGHLARRRLYGVWHRDSAGRWVMCPDQPPRYTCPRALGPEPDDAVVVPIELDWIGSHCFSVHIDADGFRLAWDVPLVESGLTSSTSQPRSSRAGSGTIR